MEPKQRYSASQCCQTERWRVSDANEGVRKMQTAERSAVIGSPDLESLTTNHVERAFLTVRQELKRFERKGWATVKAWKCTS
jgi:IS1 family transposase